MRKSPAQESSLFNDASYLQDPDRADDRRWMHRPAMDWSTADRRHDPRSVEKHISTGLCELIQVRRAHGHFHSFTLCHRIWTDNEHVLSFAGRRPACHLLVLADVSEYSQTVQAVLPRHAGLAGQPIDLLADRATLYFSAGRIERGPYGLLRLAEDEEL